MTTITAANRNARRVLAFGAVAWAGVLLVFAAGWAAGMVAHRLNELNHGGCAATYERGH